MDLVRTTDEYCEWLKSRLEMQELRLDMLEGAVFPPVIADDATPAEELDHLDGPADRMDEVLDHLDDAADRLTDAAEHLDDAAEAEEAEHDDTDAADSADAVESVDTGPDTAPDTTDDDDDDDDGSSRRGRRRPGPPIGNRR
jgi:hypothetical protein